MNTLLATANRPSQEMLHLLTFCGVGIVITLSVGLILFILLTISRKRQ